MKKLPLLLSLFIFLATLIGCEKDYDIDKKLKENYKPQVVMNSVISPDGPVVVKMFWSKRYDDKNSHRPISNFDVRLYEDGVLVEQSELCDMLYHFAHVPAEGKSYRLEADVPDYGTVKAETSIPKSAKAKVVFNKWKGNYVHFEVKQLTVQESKRAIWITTDNRKGNHYSEDKTDLFTLNPFPDQINAVLENEFITETESNIAYEYFIRIPRMNTQACVPMQFCFDATMVNAPGEPVVGWDEDGNPIIGWDDEGNPIYPEDDGEDYEILINVVTPSDEYDKYYRLLYKQELFNYEADFPIFSETVQVFSNVENGLGIFAGFSKSTAVFNFEGEEL